MDDREKVIELNYLNRTLDAVKKQLSTVLKSYESNINEITASKQQLWEDSSHSISNLWSSENFYDMIELSQSSNLISEMLAESEMEEQKIFVLRKMLDKPYFARIDFLFDGDDESEKIYIGRASLTDESYNLLVYDWRAPVSSVFYRFGMGKASYEAPSGMIEGDVTLKRQYEIKNGSLEYFFDADLQIVDEFLRNLLAQNTSVKMKTIVESIQKDQDAIIRDMKSELLMVQGAAGSGKTSVALHRAAYLMYQGLTEKLSYENILILSPNSLFEHYISNVLPELGEKNVNTLTFDEILADILPASCIQSRIELMETLLSTEEETQQRLRKEMLKFKTSETFVKILDRLIEDIPRRWLPFCDVEYDGKIIAAKDQLKNKAFTYKKTLPLGMRLKRLEESIWETVHIQRKARMAKLNRFVYDHSKRLSEAEEIARMIAIHESTNLIKQIRKFTKVDIHTIYRQLFLDKDYFMGLAKELDLPDSIEAIIAYTKDHSNDQILNYDDALGISYLRMKIEGYNDAENIRHIVIDEAQDYEAIHFEIIRLMYPKTHYTVLGDINQTIGKKNDLSVYEQFRKTLRKRNSVFINLNKSFRSTNEIIDFSSQFLDHAVQIDNFNRAGDKPAIYALENEEEYRRLLIDEINLCKSIGYKTIALICKTEKDACETYVNIKSVTDVRLIATDSKANTDGILILPVSMSKGLEFDAVLICDVDKKHYGSEDDKSLLYIACTRALHRLSLFYHGEKSPLLKFESMQGGNKDDETNL